jgi:hypothetical protein
MSVDSMTPQMRWYYDNKAELQVKYNSKHVCAICNGNYTYINKSRHLKTRRHQQGVREAGLKAELAALRGDQ